MRVDRIPNPWDLDIAGPDLQTSQALNGPVGPMLARQKPRKQQREFAGLDRDDLTNLKNPSVDIGRIDFKAKGLEIRAILRLIDESLSLGHRAMKPEQSE